MTRLINKATVSAKLQVAIGYSEADFNTFIDEAQIFDIKPLLCENFYADLLAKKDEPAYKLLIDGGSYLYNERNIEFPGIADVLSYFTYARFALKSNFVSTSHGFSVKKTPVSDPVSEGEKAHIYNHYRKDANTLFEDVKKYIERNIELFPSYKCDGCGSNPQIFKSRVIQ
jgi:hypothetical protein